ncbi:MAG: UDP binding domain-containing protein [Eubacteriales bacterium]
MKVAVLGLAFKPGTGRPEGSAGAGQYPAAAGARRGFCPATIRRRGAFFEKFPDVALASSAEEALTGAFCCFIFTEWDEVLKLSPETFRKKMRVPLVYDGRNIFDPAHEARRSGILLHRPIEGRFS